jgi:hypothetical protein
LSQAWFPNGNVSVGNIALLNLLIRATGSCHGWKRRGERHLYNIEILEPGNQ